MDKSVNPRGHLEPSQPGISRKGAGWLWGWLASLALVVGVLHGHFAFSQNSTPANPTSGVSQRIPAGYITIYGQVVHQGKYEFFPEDQLTASQAILRAGGFAKGAKDNAVKIIRKVPAKGNVTLVVNLRDVMSKGMTEKDIPLLPNDVIIVEERLAN